MIKPVKWHGGKDYLAKWILSYFPGRETYTHYNETHAGGLSVLFNHDPHGKSEAVNDLDGDLTNFWRVLSQTPDRMLRELWATPLSQEVWEASISRMADSDAVRRATAFFVRYRQSRQGLGTSYCTPTRRTRRGMNENVSAWLSAVDGLPEAHARLRQVEVRCMDAVEFIRRYDHEKALFYVDPPYLHSTRTARDAYQCEMSPVDHEKLLKCLSQIEGMFLLSGYPSDLYAQFENKFEWNRVEREIDNKASSKSTKEKKTEVLWFNYER